MRLFILCILILAAFAGYSQTIKAEVSADTIALGEWVEVTYSVENGDGEFIPPDLIDLPVVSGPNVSSSFSIVNGKKSSSQSYSYVLLPREEGKIEIPSASYNSGNEVQPIEGVVIIVGSSHSKQIKELTQPPAQKAREKRKI